MDNPLADTDVSSDDEISKIKSMDDWIPVEFQSNTVSAVNQCQSDKAKKLCIFNLDYKLQHNDHYDIGGTYTKTIPDLWFYCKTTTGPDVNYILNLFVCHRNTGTFFISISDYKVLNEVKTKDPNSYCLSLSEKLTEKTFNSVKIDQSHFLTSYCFMPEDLSNLENRTLCIPVEIKINPKCPVDRNVIMGIKARHSLTSLFKRNEDTDFVLQSKSGLNYDAHKLILATHSSVLREIIRSTKSNCVSIDIDNEEIELLLEFMYTGTVETLLDKKLYQLLEIAYKFKIENLNTLTQHAITELLNINNAVDIALLTERYHLDSIQKTVFDFIKNNPKVLETEGWHNLNDVALTKKLFKEIYVGNDSCK